MCTIRCASSQIYIYALNKNNIIIIILHRFKFKMVSCVQQSLLIILYKYIALHVCLTVIIVLIAHTPAACNSGGSGCFGCLLSKCCLKVLGSGIWLLQTGQV